MVQFMHHEVVMARVVVVGVAQYIAFSCDELELHLIIILIIYPLLCCEEIGKDPYFGLFRSRVGRILDDNISKMIMEALMIGEGLPKKQIILTNSSTLGLMVWMYVKTPTWVLQNKFGMTIFHILWGSIITHYTNLAMQTLSTLPLVKHLENLL